MDTNERGAAGGGRYVGEASSVGRSASSSSTRISDRTARSASVVCSVSPSFWGVEVGGATSVVGRAFDRGDARTRPAYDAYCARVATLDDVLWPAGAPPPPPIRLMKVDVQGFEPRVFDGAARLLAAGLVRVVKFELAPDYLAAVNGGDAAAGPRMLAALEARGFVLESAESGCARSRAAKAVVCDREVVARLNRTRARRSNPGRPS